MDEEKKPIPQQEPEPDFFTVEPKQDCPHDNQSLRQHFAEFLESVLFHYDKKSASHVFAKLGCTDCSDTKENWFCLECRAIFCSRYVKGHMAAHNEATKHPIAFSLSDGSFWCYDCDSYITTVELGRLRKTFGAIKHKMEVGPGDILKGDITENILQKLIELNGAQSTFKREDLIEGLRNGSFKNISFITGAGISTAAGIPDFRSQGGLYHQLAAKYGLTTPEEIMTLQFFKANPEPLYAIMKEFLGAQIKPTNCHKFFAEIEKRGQLLKYFTQNIDGLENLAGLSSEKMIQAHGHIRSCSCSTCAKPQKIEVLKEKIMAGEIYKCECGAPVKPDVILFGESLPSHFQAEIPKISKSDLVVIAGTSLKVYPFAYLVDLIPKTCPVVLINFDNPLKRSFDKFLFIQGDIEANITKIMHEMA